jgi:sugar phosphate isomerase/epimerase
MNADWPVGLSTGCFLERSFFDCLGPVRDAGFDLIEVCSFPAHLDYHDRPTCERAAAALRAAMVEPYSFHAPFADRIDITSLDPAVWRSSIDEIVQAATAAAILGVRYFVLHPGPERGDLPRGERLERMENAARALNQVAARCRELGVRLALENMLPHLFSGHVRELLWLLGALETTDVGICLDTGHAYLSGDLETVAQKLQGHLWMVHASDNHGSFDDHLPPGEGRVPWPRLVARLIESRFAGALILEVADRGDAERTLEGARRAKAYLRQLCAGAAASAGGVRHTGSIQGMR